MSSLLRESSLEVCRRLYGSGLGDSVIDLMSRLGYDEGELVGCALPWCGEVVEGNCACLKLNGGLHTQCVKRAEVGEYCKSCKLSVDRNGGSSVYGTVSDRLKCGVLDYVDPKGRLTLPYANVMKKLNISRSVAEAEAIRVGWSIPECHFEERVGKRGRPKKEVGESEKVEKKKRGRPRKEKEVVSNDVGEELIASLMREQVEGVVEAGVLADGVMAADVMEEEEEGVVEEEEEEETKVVKFDIDGKMYLKSEDNMLFDMESHDAIGLWNEENKCIDVVEEEE